VQEVQEMSKNTRRIGLGVMGYADLLYQLGIRYDSDEGMRMAELTMKTIQDESHRTSVTLAEDKGVFPHWKESTWYTQGIKRRNTMVTTVAPTGSISMFFDTSSGIEPNFALSFTKQDKDGHTYRYVNQHLEQALRDRGIYSDGLMDQIILEGSLQNVAGVPQDIKDVFRVSMDIAARDHIRAQAAFQKHVENSISKTINFPNEASVKDIEDGYIMAWKLGCKGCTLYRDGSREVQVLNLNKNLDKAKSLAPGMENVSLSGAMGKDKVADPSRLGDRAVADGARLNSTETPEPARLAAKVLSGTVVNGNGNHEETQTGRTLVRERPDVMNGLTYRIRTSYGNMFVTINEDENGPFEVFSQLGKAGGFFQAQTEAICRLISLGLRSGIGINVVIDQLKGIRGPDIMFSNGGTIHSLPDAIARVLENHIKRGQTELSLNFGAKETKKLESAPEMVVSAMPVSGSETTNGHSAQKQSIANFGHAPACPDCGSSSMILKEGCMTCQMCGFSKCG